MATLAPGVLKRMELNKDLPIELKTIYNGQLTVHNVPHIKREYPGPNGDMFYLQSNVMYTLSYIFQEMINNGDKEYDYSEFQF